VNNVYRVTLLNPSGNPDEIEEEYITADNQPEAENEAAGIIARHPFNDIQLLDVKLVDPQDLYHEESPDTI
jgi:hypothetical protein